MKLVVTVGALLALGAGCKSNADAPARRAPADATRVAPSAAAIAVDAAAPSVGLDLVGVWSTVPEVVAGRYHDVEILRADGTYEWRVSELACATNQVRITGTWTMDGDRLRVETRQLQAWEGDRPRADPRCAHAGQTLATTERIELAREPVTPCPGEVEYARPGPDVIVTRARTAKLAFPCVVHGLDAKFKVASVEAYDAAHPPSVAGAVAP